MTTQTQSMKQFVRAAVLVAIVAVLVFVTV